MAVSCSIDWLERDSGPLSIEEYQARYIVAGDPWAGDHVENLVRVLGPPDDIFEATPRYCSPAHGVRLLSYVYYNEAAEDRSRIDTYIVVEGTGVVIKYYRR